MKKLQFVNAKEICRLRAQLENMTTGWSEDDGSIPANLVLKDGMGTKLAEVNRWCGGFQQPQHPMMIGWKAQVGNRCESGAIIVQHSDCKCSEAKKRAAVDHAMEEAKDLAEKALRKLRKED